MPGVAGGRRRTSAGGVTDLRSRVLAQGDIPGVDPRLAVDTTTNPNDEVRPVYRCLQMFEDVMYPWDRSVVKALRAFDPRIVPLSSVSVYRYPDGGEHRFLRHVIALEVNPLEFSEPQFVNLMAPTSPASINYGRRPNTWLKGWSGPQPKDKVTPGDYWPFDWEVVNYLRSRFKTYDSNTERVMKEWFDAEDQAKQATLDALDREIDYRLEHDKVHLREAARRVDPELVKRGMLYDTTPNPFVHLGRMAR